MNIDSSRLLGVCAGLSLVAGCFSVCSTSCDCSCNGSDAYAPVISEGFTTLFDATAGTGAWQGSKDYKRLPGSPDTLECIPTGAAGEEGSGGNFCTKKEYRNFILRFEYCMPENGNNGLGIRMKKVADTAAYDGMCEIQLLDDGGSEYYDAKAKRDRIKPWQYTGSIYGVKPVLRDNVGKMIWGKEKLFAAGGSYSRIAGFWNFMEVRVIGEEIEVWLNGYLVNKADLSKWTGKGDTVDGKQHPGLHNARGFIGWQGHGSHVKWRNIRIKELPDDAKMADYVSNAVMPAPAGFEPYFSGCPKQLQAMWKGVTREGKFDQPEVRQNATPAKRAEMQTLADKGRDEHWHVLGDKSLYFDGFQGGYSLATKRDYKDFELWADWRLLSVTGDSGLYLRGLPQVQIWDAHNYWHIGSGGLYNNKKNPSRATSIADTQIGDWNRFHVIMRGEKVTVWLNGVKVVDNVTLENIRDRAKPCYPIEQIELQCHGDPLAWSNVFIREL